MRESAAWAFGDECQRTWAALLPHAGYAVFPAYVFEHNVSPDIGAPVILMPDGSHPAVPDLFIAGVNMTPQLHEVKGKAEPTWRKYPFPGQWEHGIDWAAAEDYRGIQQQTSLPVVIAIYEARTPEDAEHFSPLAARDYWLTIPLDRAFEWGAHRTDWPGGARAPWRRGKRGAGGLLWPRAAMNLYLGAGVA